MTIVVLVWISVLLLLQLRLLRIWVGGVARITDASTAVLYVVSSRIGMLLLLICPPKRRRIRITEMKIVVVVSVATVCIATSTIPIVTVIVLISPALSRIWIVATHTKTRLSEDRGGIKQ